MVVSIRSWASRLMFIIIFAVMLFIVAIGYRLLVEAIAPVHPYQEPKGDAIKVFVTDPDTPESGTQADRLRWFYWYGE